MRYRAYTSKLSKRIRDNLKISLGYTVKQVSVRIVHNNRIKVTIKDRSIDIEAVQEVAGDTAEVDYSWDIY